MEIIRISKLAIIISLLQVCDVDLLHLEHGVCRSFTARCATVRHGILSICLSGLDVVKRLCQHGQLAIACLRAKITVILPGPREVQIRPHRDR
jgi:hypothetical protein